MLGSGKCSPGLSCSKGGYHWIKHCPLDNSIGFGSIYPLDGTIHALNNWGLLDTTIHWINQYLLYTSTNHFIALIRWIVIYPVDSAIHSLNDWGRV